jgi:hypothetical protein
MSRASASSSFFTFFMVSPRDELARSRGRANYAQIRIFGQAPRFRWSDGVAFPSRSFSTDEHDLFLA